MPITPSVGVAVAEPLIHQKPATSTFNLIYIKTRSDTYDVDLMYANREKIW